MGSTKSFLLHKTMSDQTSPTRDLNRGLSRHGWFPDSSFLERGYLANPMKVNHMCSSVRGWGEGRGGEAKDVTTRFSSILTPGISTAVDCVCLYIRVHNMCIQMRMYVCTYRYVYIYACVCVLYICISTYTHIFTHVGTYVSMYVCMYVQVYTYAWIHICLYVCMRIYIWRSKIL